MLIDSTLREGEQFYGAYFSNAARKTIVSGLVAAGVEEIELGCVGQEHLPALAAWAMGHCGARFSVWCPCREDSLNMAADLGVRRVNVGVPVSDRHLGPRLGWTRSRLLRRLETLPQTARDLGIMELSVGFEDATGADPGFLVEAAATAAKSGAVRIRLADTLGLASPDDMARLVRGVAGSVHAPLAVHCHNDYGMATANALAALDAGATWADCTLLGIGERAGIAATEQLAAYLAITHGAGYDLQALRAACLMTAEQAQLPIARNKPIVGRDLFRCESGLHVHGLERDPALYEPFPPERVGLERRTALGGKSGRAAVRRALHDAGATPRAEDRALLDALLAKVRRLARSLGRPLHDEEFLRLCRNEALVRTG
jgi:homocitrate synthase NifV